MICSGVENIYCNRLYQERPLKIFDWFNGNRLPLKVIVLELKFGLMVTVALLPPLVSVRNICAEMPIPWMLKLQLMLPRLSVDIFISDTVPSTVTPPIPLGPG